MLARWRHTTATHKSPTNNTVMGRSATKNAAATGAITAPVRDPTDTMPRVSNMAMAKPVIAGDNRATRELLCHGKNAYLVPMADARALAAAINELRRNDSLRETIARGGHELFLSTSATDKTAHALAACVEGASRPE